MKQFLLLICTAILISASCCTQKQSSPYMVYVSATGNKYHTSSCRYLSKSCIPLSLSDASIKNYEPCTDCSPPLVPSLIDSLKTEKVEPEQTAQPATVEDAVENKRCAAFTQKGPRCKRNAAKGSDKCWQHKDL